MTLLAVGLDLVEIARVAHLLETYGERAWHRLLTDAEASYCRARAEPARHVAARLAAKEAAYKALANGGDPGYVAWREVEVARALDGRPNLALHGRAAEAAARLRVGRVMLSLTHTDCHAAAVVVLVA